MSRVWAPEAKTVRMHVGDECIDLKKDADGWWRTRDVSLRHGQRYKFEVDGRGPFPDPRSPHQPQGVHGPSCHVDHSQFQWTDKLWQPRPLSSAVMYELHVGTFTPEGTFDAVIPRLDHLLELGITHIELLPVAEFLGDYGWGYDGVSLFAPHHAYGGPDGLKRLVNACHERGIAVLMDVVYNHLGPSGNYLGQFAPYFSDRHHTPWGSAINFDGPDSDEVRRFFCDNAIMWLEDYHIDGLRLDAVHAIVDTSAMPFLEQLATEVDEQGHLGRHLVVTAESDLNDPRIIRPWEQGGFGINAQWCDDIHHSLHTVLTGQREGYYADFGSLQDLCSCMTRPFVYAGRHSPFRRRRHGRPPLGGIGSRFIAYLQNHDQLGNRAQGERICHLVNRQRVKIGAALILTSPYIPMLFQGEEWSATSPFQYFVDFGSEPDLDRAVAEGRCKEFASFGWDPEQVPDPTERSTFERSRLKWEELSEPEHADMLQWYRRLIELRKTLPSLTSGRLDMVAAACDTEKQWLRVEREPITIVCNFSEEALDVPCPFGHDSTLLLASNDQCSIQSNAVYMPKESVAIVGPVQFLKQHGLAS